MWYSLATILHELNRFVPVILAVASSTYFAVNESDLARLGLKGVGDRAEVLGKRVRLVGTVRGMKSLAAPFVFCSLQTAHRLLLGVPQDQTVYILARTRSPQDAEAVAQRLR